MQNLQDLSAKDFYRKTKYNTDTQNQIWLSLVADSHDCWCDCDHPFAHLLASIFPPGHADRPQSINYILARDYTEKCLSGGADAENSGMAAGDLPEDEKPSRESLEKDLPIAEVEELLAAAAASAATR